MSDIVFGMLCGLTLILIAFYVALTGPGEKEFARAEFKQVCAEQGGRAVHNGQHMVCLWGTFTQNGD